MSISACSLGFPYTLVNKVSREYKLPLTRLLFIALAIVFSSIAAKRGAPPEKKQERVVDDPCGEIIGELHKLTKSPSLVAPYSEIKRLVAELREAYRKQHGRS